MTAVSPNHSTSSSELATLQSSANPPAPENQDGATEPALEALVEKGDSIDEFIELSSSSPPSCIQNAFVKAVKYNRCSIIQHCLENLSNLLTPDGVVASLDICLENGNDALFQTLLSHKLFAKVPEERSEGLQQLYYKALEKARLDRLADFYEIPTCKEILNNILTGLFAFTLKYKPVPTIHKFLFARWSIGLSPEDLAAGIALIADSDNFFKFKGVLMHPRFDKVENCSISFKLKIEQAQSLLDHAHQFTSQEAFLQNRILGIACITCLSLGKVVILLKEYLLHVEVRDLYQGFCRAILCGYSEPVAQILKQALEILGEMGEAKLEGLFMHVYQNSFDHPSNLEIAEIIIAYLKTFPEKTPGRWQKVIDDCILLCGQLGLVGGLAILAKTEAFKKTDSSILIQSFHSAAAEGHTATLDVVINSSRIKDIIPAIVEIFDLLLTNPKNLSLRASATFLLLTKECCNRISTSDANRIFQNLCTNAEEDLALSFICLDLIEYISDKTYEKTLQPLVDLGDKFSEYDDYLQTFNRLYPWIWKAKTILSEIVKLFCFKDVFTPQDSETTSKKLSSLFIASAGLGLFTIVERILTTRSDELETSAIAFAAFQASINKEFFAFRENSEMVNNKPHIIMKSIPLENEPDGKLNIMHLLLQDDRLTSDRSALSLCLRIAKEHKNDPIVETLTKNIAYNTDDLKDSNIKKP